jgi:hypothetical protein
VGSSNFTFWPHLLPSQDSQRPTKGDSLLENQPFLEVSSMNPVDRFVARLTREQGQWTDAMPAEQTAFALAQVSAATILPPLVDLDNGNALLDYRVFLRDHLDPALISELVCVLDTRGQEFHWGQVDATVYASVIGAGVAACIDTAPENETLYLRYATTLAAELFVAGRTTEMPRSQLFLQTALYERVDILLEQMRIRTWYWLI